MNRVNGQQQPIQMPPKPPTPKVLQEILGAIQSPTNNVVNNNININGGFNMLNANGIGNLSNGNLASLANGVNNSPQILEQNLEAFKANHARQQQWMTQPNGISNSIGNTMIGGLTTSIGNTATTPIAIGNTATTPIANGLNGLNLNGIIPPPHPISLSGSNVQLHQFSAGNVSVPMATLSQPNLGTQFPFGSIPQVSLVSPRPIDGSIPGAPLVMTQPPPLNFQLSADLLSPTSALKLQ